MGTDWKSTKGTFWMMEICLDVDDSYTSVHICKFIPNTLKTYVCHFDLHTYVFVCVYAYM